MDSSLTLDNLGLDIASVQSLQGSEDGILLLRWLEAQASILELSNVSYPQGKNLQLTSPLWREIVLTEEEVQL